MVKYISTEEPFKFIIDKTKHSRTIISTGFRCQYCGYWTGKKKRIPTRYVFHLKKQKT